MIQVNPSVILYDCTQMKNTVLSFSGPCDVGKYQASTDFDPGKDKKVVIGHIFLSRSWNQSR